MKGSAGLSDVGSDGGETTERRRRGGGGEGEGREGRWEEVRERERGVWD